MNAAALIIASPLSGTTPDAAGSAGAAGAEFAALMAGVLAPAVVVPAAATASTPTPPTSSTETEQAITVGRNTSASASAASTLLFSGEAGARIVTPGDITRPATLDGPAQLVGVEGGTISSSLTPTASGLGESESAGSARPGTPRAPTPSDATTPQTTDSSAAVSTPVSLSTGPAVAMGVHPGDLQPAPITAAAPTGPSQPSTIMPAVDLRAPADAPAPLVSAAPEHARTRPDSAELAESPGFAAAARRSAPELTTLKAEPSATVVSSTGETKGPVGAIVSRARDATPQASEGRTASTPPALQAGLAAQLASPAVLAMSARSVAPTRPAGAPATSAAVATAQSAPESQPVARTSTPASPAVIQSTTSTPAGTTATPVGVFGAAPAPLAAELLEGSPTQQPQAAARASGAVVQAAAPSPAPSNAPKDAGKVIAPQAAQPASGSAPEAVATADRTPLSQVEVPLETSASVREPAQVEGRLVEAASASAPVETRAGPTPVRGAPETVASLAAEIGRKLQDRNTRFEVALDPAGLGMVNVSIDIGADGRMSAQLAFERPEAAAELRGRSAELQRALEQAGFDLSRGGLSFTGEGGRERSGGDQPRGQNARAQAFQHALLAAEAADTLPTHPMRLRDRAGLDVRI